ncbi:MAG: hypothetical protein HKN87_19090 [Saprospiraceae bacterium]|nr:hypothetical protein [Saprospiraceae bacterium]
MKTLLTLILVIHGLIHFMGFAKAFGYGNVNQLTKEISKPIGVLWLIVGSLLIVSTVLLHVRKELWPFLGIVAALGSQVLIFLFWQDAKFGTIANIIILILATIGAAEIIFENSFMKDVAQAMDIDPPAHDERITDEDLSGLPIPVRKYLEYTGVVGKPKVRNVKIVFEGQMRKKGKDWFNFTSEQYNFTSDPTRLFFMKAKISGIPTTGYHRYRNDGASMLIKLASLFPVAKIDGPEMFPTETVTFFNDLCLFAPGALIDARIKWHAIDHESAKATFTTDNATISATLFFNDKGQLVNFISDDRYSVSEMKTFPFSTPIEDYIEILGYRLPSYGEAIWHFPDADFTYGKFHLQSIDFNVGQTTIQSDP